MTPPTVVAVKLSATQAAISWEAVLSLSLLMPPPVPMSSRRSWSGPARPGYGLMNCLLDIALDADKGPCCIGYDQVRAARLPA